MSCEMMCADFISFIFSDDATGVFISYMEAAFSQCTATHFSSWPQWWSNIYSVIWI